MGSAYRFNTRKTHISAPTAPSSWYHISMKTIDDLLRAILAILPNATIGEDNYGQIIVYTDKMEDIVTKELEDFVLDEEDDN